VETLWIAFAPVVPQSQAGTYNIERCPWLVWPGNFCWLEPQISC
jgi:hypothetical protein